MISAVLRCSYASLILLFASVLPTLQAAESSATPGPEAVAGNVVWQLGVPDGSSAEFLPFSNREFRYNTQVAAQPGYNGTEHRFVYRVEENRVVERPLFPAGISGKGAGNHTYLTGEAIVWDDPTGGERVLELKLLDSGSRNFLAHQNTPNENMDLDGMDLLKPTLRIALPGQQVVHQYLPYDLGAYLRKNGSLVIRASFQALPGRNEIRLQETSGQSYARCYHFDYLRVSVAPRFANPPVLELTPGSGFQYATLYPAGAAARLEAKAYNLNPQKRYTVKVRFVDYFNREAGVLETVAQPGADGTLGVAVPCPAGIRGHLRVSAQLLLEGAALELQCGQKEIVTRLAALHSIAPLSEEEIERSFVGVCGMPASTLFDPYLALSDYKRDVEHYRQYRRALQIHNERIHSLAWNFLEKEEGVYRWDYWDWMLQGEQKDRIRVQLTILGTPQWLARKAWPERAAGSVWEWSMSCPPQMDPWRKVCAAIATRYRDRVRDIELWNEMSDHSVFWYKANADDCYELIKNGSEAIRQAASGMNVVAETVWARQEDFWQRLYRRGVGAYVDYPADHYMTDERIRQVNGFLDMQGRGKGLINNEAKCDSVGGLGEVDEPMRRLAAQNLLRNMLHMNANRIGRIYNFMITGTTWRLYGLVGPDGTPKYTFNIMKTLVNRTTGAEFVRTFDFSKDIEAYFYSYFSPQRAAENGGENILFLINRGHERQTLSLYTGKPEVTVVDCMDNARKVQTEQGVLTLELENDCTMVIGADPQALQMQTALTLQNLNADAAPGADLKFRLGLAEDAAGVQEARVKLGAQTLGADGLEEVVLRPGQTQDVRVPLRRDLAEGVYNIKTTAVLRTASGEVRIPREHAVVLSALRPGQNYFAAGTFDPGRREWCKWGDAEMNAVPGATPASVGVNVTVQGTGALRNVHPIPLVEGQTYYLSLRARGSGLLRVMTVIDKADGTTVTAKNVLNLDLSPESQEVRGEFTAPPGARNLTLHCYQYRSQGEMELSQLFLTRVPAGVPLNRLLYQMPAHALEGVSGNVLAGDWPKDWFVPLPSTAADVRLVDYKGAADLSGSFACGWSGQTLQVQLRVRDDQRVTAPAGGNLWEYDSVQLDIEPQNAGRNTESCQFSFGLANGKATSFRHRVIPTPDIVPSYRTGPDPEGVRCDIRREGEEMVYRIAIPAAAILPTLHLQAGQTLAFSVLLNDNDGQGRRGWIAWSGGIGESHDTTRFGALTLQEPGR